ncbi:MULTISPECIES: hypothetical protein [Streptomyces]|uniref:hypothetical protein n=1 Tax=Streptomyces TaxID=1883 RepID=UPI0004CB6CD5|nr:hypothetical protein [Streptomyces sp. NRRL S-146]
MPADDDLVIEAEEVAEFLREAALLREHLDAIAETTRRPADSPSTARGWCGGCGTRRWPPCMPG